MRPINAPGPGHPDPFIVHIAGPPQLGGLRQECTRCGHVLQDYVGKQIMVAVEPGEEPPTLALWAEGAQVATLDGMSYLVQGGRALDEDERECRPTS